MHADLYFYTCKVLGKAKRISLPRSKVTSVIYTRNNMFARIATVTYLPNKRSRLPRSNHPAPNPWCWFQKDYMREFRGKRSLSANGDAPQAETRSLVRGEKHKLKYKGFHLLRRGSSASERKRRCV